MNGYDSTPADEPLIAVNRVTRENMSDMEQVNALLATAIHRAESSECNDIYGLIDEIEDALAERGLMYTSDTVEIIAIVARSFAGENYDDAIRKMRHFAKFVLGVIVE